MGLIGAGMLTIWCDVPPDYFVEFNEWNNREHMPERIAIPGLLRSRRLVALKGSPQILCLHEGRDAEVFIGPDFMNSMKSPTPWSVKTASKLFNLTRAAGRHLKNVGTGIGGFMGAIRMSGIPEVADVQELDEVTAGKVMEEILALPGIVGATAIMGFLKASDVQSKEREQRKTPDGRLKWMILIEGSSQGAVEDACKFLLDKNGSKLRVPSNLLIGTYQLQFVDYGR